MPAPSSERALEQYRRAAPRYDRHMRRFARWQRLAVERLELQPDQTVLDVACGTGLTFPSLEARVGPGGKIVGIDLSPEMLARAQKRVDAQGWDNVALIEASVEEAEFASPADAALFSFTHDVLQSPLAVANVVAHLTPGARVASRRQVRQRLEPGGQLLRSPVGRTIRKYFRGPGTTVARAGELRNRPRRSAAGARRRVRRRGSYPGRGVHQSRGETAIDAWPCRLTAEPVRWICEELPDRSPAAQSPLTAGLSSAHAAMFSESAMTSPSSRTSTGT